MNLTAILTTECNLGCTYCYERGRFPRQQMSREVAMKVCELAASSPAGERCGISFFGGEPLLRKELIYDMVAYCDTLGDFSYNTTTNGLLLDDRFLELVRGHRFRVALSHDGLAQDVCRCFSDGTGSACRLTKALEAVVTLPASAVMLTFTPRTAHMLAESVAWLFDKGARKVIITPDGRPTAGWGDESMDILAQQYDSIALDYEGRLLRGDNVRFPGFDSIISDRVTGNDRCNSCRLGYRQPIVFCDGSIYPCIQFTAIEEYRIGDVFSGIDERRRYEIYCRSIRPVETCTDCPEAYRCRHSCACVNFEQTGNMNTVSPFTCTDQRLLISAADSMAERIYAKDAELFARVFGSSGEDE